MKRDFGQLDQKEPFDMLVIGGGIYGTWIACDAALRGLSVALVEANDWGGGTSQSSSKLIHGGLRYLEHFHFGLVKKALAERRRLARIAPHRVYPLNFALPVYRGDRVGMLKLEAGLWLYDRLAGAGQPVDPHKAYSRKGMTGRYPFLVTDGLKGGFTYGDCGTDDARFALEVAAGAMEAGAVCVNHAEVLELIRDNGHITGAVVRDGEGGNTIEVKSRLTVNAAGPWAGRIKGMPPAAKDALRLVKGVHLILPSLGTDDAFLLTARSDGRVFFLIPWYGRTLVGTTDEDYPGDPARVDVTDADVDYLLTESNRVLNGISWGPSDILGGFAGVRTLVNAPDDSPTDVTREWTLLAPQEGLLMPVGGKFTSARVEAAFTVARACEELGRNPGLCPTRKKPTAWAPGGDYLKWQGAATDQGAALGLDGETAHWCARRFGITVEAVHRLIENDRALAERIVPDAPFCMAEAVHAVQNEMARTLSDVLRRRMPLSILSALDGAARLRVAERIGPELGWSKQRVKEEAESVYSQYAPRD